MKRIHDHPYALVLAGGGAKGVYQIGAWKAFRELGLRFEAVIGASVGALNGALIVQDNFDGALELWCSMSLDRIIALPGEILHDGNLHLNGNTFAYLRKIRDEFFKKGGLDTSPLRRIIEKYADEKKIRASGIDFGVMAYEISGFKPKEIFVDAMPEGLLTDYLLGSASFPGFKAVKVLGKELVDGGLADNVPFSAAKERGYRRIIVVDVSGIGFTRKPDISETETVYIKNSLDFGNILDFRREFLADFMDLGYLDTLRTFGKLQGMVYFIEPDEKLLKKLDTVLSSGIFLEKIKKESEKMNWNGQSLPEFLRGILSTRGSKQKHLSLALLENSAELLKVRRIRKYTLDQFCREIQMNLNRKKTEDPDFLVTKIHHSLEDFFNGNEERNILALKACMILLDGLKANSKSLKYPKNK